MPTLTLTKNYADATILFASDFDVWLTELETFLNTTKIDDGNLLDASITASTSITDASITTVKLPSNAVTTAKIADSGVEEGDFALLAATTAKLADASVTTEKILDANVTTAKVGTSAITRTKLTASNYAISSSINYAFYNSSYYPGTPNLTTSDQSIPNATVTITTNGNPVEVRVMPILYAIPNGGFIQAIEPGGGYTVFTVYRDAVAIAVLEMNEAVSDFSQSTNISSSIMGIGPILDSPSAGTYTYTLKVKSSSATVPTIFIKGKLSVREL